MLQIVSSLFFVAASILLVGYAMTTRMLWLVGAIFCLLFGILFQKMKNR